MATAKKKPAAKKAPVKKISTAAKKPYKDNTPDNTTPPKNRPPDAVDLLVADHLAAGKVFKQYEKLAKKNASPAERKKLANKVCDMLTVHMAIEEEIFYPAARAAKVEADEMDEVAYASSTRRPRSWSRKCSPASRATSTTTPRSRCSTI